MTSALVAAGLVGAAAVWLLSARAISGPTVIVTSAEVIAISLVWPLLWLASYRLVQAGWPLHLEARRPSPRPAPARAAAARVAEAVLPPEASCACNPSCDHWDACQRKPRRPPPPEPSSLVAPLDEQSALLAAVSHELQSPLLRLRLLVDLHQAGMVGDDVHGKLKSELDDIDTLVHDLLDGARIEFGALQHMELSAAELGRRAIEVAKVPATVEGDEDLAVLADPTLVIRALRGVLDNAQHYGGAVAAFRVYADEDLVRFEVDDDGPGFAEGEVERAFEPFWRRPGQREGTGLGLALVRRIAEAHGGTATAHNRDEGGARVCLELPAA